MSDEEEPECADCQSTGGDVMNRVVGSTQHTLCRDCADRRRRAPGQTRASKPPESPSKVWGGDE